MFPSLKMKTRIYFESLIEADCIYLLEFDPAISFYREQPLTIHYQTDGRARRYTPDFHAVRSGQDVVIVCKPAHQVNRPENQRKFTAARAWCAQEGAIFEVMTDESLREGWRLQNIKDLHYFARYTFAPAEKEAIQKAIVQLGAAATIGDVLMAVSPTAPLYAMSLIMHMAWWHEVILPLDDARIGPETSIRLP
jgi:hypothetical protein